MSALGSGMCIFDKFKTNVIVILEVSFYSQSPSPGHWDQQPCLYYMTLTLAGLGQLPSLCRLTLVRQTWSELTSDLRAFAGGDGDLFQCMPLPQDTGSTGIHTWLCASRGPALHTVLLEAQKESALP